MTGLASGTTDPDGRIPIRLGWSVPLPGPFRLSGTLWRSKRRRPKRRGPARPVYHGTLPGWKCTHNHSREDLAVACAQRESKRRAAARTGGRSH
jgi:hypothetical protein